jgi:hypothetical protein
MSLLKEIGDRNREAICEPDGWELIGADFSLFECAYTAAIAGETWKVEACAKFFRTRAEADDPYIQMAGWFGVTGEGARDVGKATELAHGFFGGPASFFRRYPDSPLSQEEAERRCRIWRDRHPRIRQFGYGLEAAAVAAVRTPTVPQLFGGHKLYCRMIGPLNFLFIELPSGRAIAYPNAHLVDYEFKGQIRQAVAFMENNSQRRWQPYIGPGGKPFAWPGLFLENIVQAGTRDIVAAAMLRLEAAGFEVTLTVHDEILARVREGEGSLEAFKSIIETPPPWAAAMGLPIGCKVWRRKSWSPNRTAPVIHAPGGLVTPDMLATPQRIAVPAHLKPPKPARPKIAKPKAVRPDQPGGDQPERTKPLKGIRHPDGTLLPPGMTVEQYDARIAQLRRERIDQVAEFERRGDVPLATLNLARRLAGLPVQDAAAPASLSVSPEPASPSLSSPPSESPVANKSVDAAPVEPACPDGEGKPDGVDDPPAAIPRLPGAAIPEEPRPEATPSEDFIADPAGAVSAPDRDEAARFLALLDPTATRFTFQSFDDAKSRKDGRLARILHGTLDEHFAELARLNARGAGIFVTINETDFKGRTIANITRVRALFADFDGGAALPTDGPQPYIIVQSSETGRHLYWKADDVALDTFTATQELIIKRFSSDPKPKDLPRVMRLPGFLHRKSAPFLSRIVDVHEDAPACTAANFGTVSANREEIPEWIKADVGLDVDPTMTEGGGPWAILNALALANLDKWVPQLFGDLAKYQKGTGAWRIASKVLGRDLQEDLSIHPRGITDWGTDDLGTNHQTRYSAIDLVAEYRGIGAQAAFDWLDARLRGDDREQQTADQTAQANTIEPVDLWAHFEPPALPADLLPKTIADFAIEQGTLIGADPAGLAVAALTVCAAAIPDTIRLKVKRHGSWTESTRLWGALVGHVSTKKTPMLNAATWPLVEIDDALSRV